jgi:AcrR family transcriptional regulator
MASQRERLLQAMLAEVSERGYGSTRVQDVCTRAGVSSQTFYEFFADKEDCYLAAFGGAVESLVSHVAVAHERHGPWPDQVGESLGAFLGCLDSRPQLARAAMVEVHAAGVQARVRYSEAVEQLAAYLDRGRDHAPPEVAPPARTSAMVIGGVGSVVLEAVGTDQPGELSALFPELFYALLVPYLGPQLALTEVTRAKSSEPGRSQAANPGAPEDPC